MSGYLAAAVLGGFAYSVLGVAFAHLVYWDDRTKMTYEQKQHRDAVLGAVLTWPTGVFLAAVMVLAFPMIWLGDRSEARARARHEARRRAVNGGDAGASSASTAEAGHG